VSTWGPGGRRVDYAFGRQNSPEHCAFPDFVYRIDGTSPDWEPAVIGGWVSLSVKKWLIASCIGCGHSMHERASGNCCPFCAPYAATGRVVDPGGGSWVEGEGDYIKGRHWTIDVSDFVRHDPYTISAGTDDDKTETVLISRFALRDPSRNYDPTRRTTQPRASVDHRWYIAFLATTKHGRAHLSPQQLAWHKARQRRQRKLLNVAHKPTQSALGTRSATGRTHIGAAP
jgi:hypothetical protein